MFSYLKSCRHVCCGVLVAVALGLAVGAVPRAARAAEDTSFTVNGAPVGMDDMARARGGASPVVATQTLSATATGNVVNAAGDFTTGTIAVGDGFGAGIGSYVLNTGANTAINSAMNVSVVLYSGPAP